MSAGRLGRNAPRVKPARTRWATRRGEAGAAGLCGAVSCSSGAEVAGLGGRSRLARVACSALRGRLANIARPEPLTLEIGRDSRRMRRPEV
eukprot:3489911-Prymnesium_polylepis.1